MRLKNCSNHLALLGLLWLLHMPAKAFINIEEIRLQRDQGISGSTGLKLEGASGNSQRFLTEFSTLNLYRESIWEYIVLGKYRYGESHHIKDTHEGHLHARVMRTMTERFSIESFVQTEFSEFLRLQRRDLLGVGLRTQLERTENGSLYLGTGMFYEMELLNEKQRRQQALRGNFYLSYARQFQNKATGSLTGYYQPSTKRIDDYRLQLDAGLSVPMIQNLSLVLDVNLQKDSQPPDAVEPTDIRYLTGLTYIY